MEILILIALVLLNGVFAMAEMSLVSARRFKLESAKKKGSKGARTALSLAEHPTRFLSTVQIGITLIGILLGVYSGENLTGGLAAILGRVPFLAPHADTLALGLVVVLVTYLSIVLGELLPKRLGMTFPEPIAIALSVPMQWLSALTAPFVWLLTATNEFLLALLGIRHGKGSAVSEEEIKLMVRESAEGGEIQDVEQEIVERVFELGDRKVDSLFTHRSQIVFLNVDDDWETVRAKITSERHSSYPVCEDNDLDRIAGMALLKDLFTIQPEGPLDLRRILRQPLFVNESTFGYRMLEMFKQHRMHHAIVVDEFGSTQGIVTMDDVVDALVGDATESDQDEFQIVQRDERSWLVDGQFGALEFFRYFDHDPHEYRNARFVTVAGLMIFLRKALPRVGEKVRWGDYDLEVVDKDGQRIDKILVTRV